MSGQGPARGGQAPASWTCRRCSMVRTQRGTSDHLCPDCVRKQLQATRGMDPQAFGFRLLAALQDYRLAIELAASCLRRGDLQEALGHLDSVQAPDKGRQRFDALQKAELARLKEVVDADRRAKEEEFWASQDELAAVPPELPELGADDGR